MKKNVVGVFCFIMHLLAFDSSAQMITLVPNAGYPGHTMNIMIRANGISFVSGKTTISLGQGITVNRFDVLDVNSGTANISISQGASNGLRTLSVSSMGTNLNQEDAFEVFSPGSSVRVLLEVIPVQTIYISDFDPANMSSAPLLFTYTIFNDDQVRNLKVKMTVAGQQYGEIISGTKQINNVSPNGIRNYNNRNFDEYKVSIAGHEIRRISFQSGMLPADVYKCIINVYDGNTLLASDEGVNHVTNPVSDLNLIGPGSPIGETPELLYNSNPFFQWFSQASSFEFSIYMVNPGQTSAQDIVMNQHVYRKEDMAGNNLLYPNSAELLQPGKMYAWQVKANVRSGSGTQSLKSEVFWFKMATQASGSVSDISRIEINPKDVNVDNGATFQFNARAFNETGEIINVNPVWKVIPSAEGIISQSGLFTAGMRPKTVAVLVEYQGKKDYATVQILPKFQDWDMNKMIRQIFGLPPSN